MLLTTTACQEPRPQNNGRDSLCAHVDKLVGCLPRLEQVLTILVTALLCIAYDGEAVRQVDRPQAHPARQEPELTPREAAKIPPLPPTNVTMQRSPRGVTLTWEKSPGDDVATYRIYRKGRDAKLVKVGESTSSKFVDRSRQRGSEYSITAVGPYGAESQPASAVRKKAKP
jgi:hypothetical protein